MNSSLLHLSIKNFYNYPMVVVPKRMLAQSFKIKSSKFANFFGNAFHIKSGATSFYSSSFAKFLDRPLLFTSESISDQKYNSRYNVLNQNSITVSHCFFCDCKSLDDKGGCLSCENVSNVFILNSDFTKCSAGQKGGAISIEKFSNCTIAKCCFSQSYAETTLTMNIVAERKRHRWLNINHCTVSKCVEKTKKKLLYFEAGFQEFSMNNITLNSVSERIFHSVAPMNASINYINFVKNDGAKFFTREILPLSSEKYVRCNFVENSANDDVLFCVEVFAEARDFIFILNKFKFFAAAKAESHFSLHDCRSDIPAHNIRMQNGDDYVSVLFEDFVYIKKYLTPYKMHHGETCNFITVPKIFTPKPLPVRVVQSLVDSTDYPEKFGILLLICVIIIIWLMLCLKRGSRRRRNGW